MKRLASYILLASWSFGLFAENKEQPTLLIKRAAGSIIIDGELRETDWQNAEVAENFFKSFPDDTSYAETLTKVRVTYDEHNIYIAAECYDEVKGDYVIQSLKRDFSFPVSDAFAVFLDPFNDHLNGFSFAVNPLGVQREGLVEGGGGFGVTTSWDNKWSSEVKHYDGYWVVEMSIPYKTIRYKEGTSTWGINFARNDLKRNERSAWSPVPINFNIASLAFTGQMKWDTPPAKAGANITVIPYAIGNTSRDIDNKEEIETGGNIGGDIKIAVSSSLNLDLTINPDFSQVEVDRQQTNLTRFSLFFPEKRQFFIENSDLFGDFGFRQIRPFFSRNIGLYQGQQIPIIAGARLSGKINKKTRIGVMNLQTAADTPLDLKSQNYGVLAIQRTVLGDSYLAGIFVNRQAIENNEFSPNDYNRVLGVDFNLVTKSNKWRGKVFYHQGLTSENLPNSYTHASWLMFNSKRFFAMWNHEYAGENYQPEVGFVPRNQQYNSETESFESVSYYRLEPMFEYKIYPKGGPINYHGPALYINNYYNINLEPTDLFFMPNYKINFQNTSVLEVHYHDVFTKLNYDFDVTYSGGAPLPAGNYYYRNFLIKFESNTRKKLSGKLKANYGGFYSGTKLTTIGDISYRQQPWGIFSMNVEQNEIHLPDSFPDASIWLVGPKIEVSFTRSMFFTTFIQYNTQQENVNINSRFQWRFKPMSDLYIVYTENYLPPTFDVKNRALVVKLIYWLGL
ncbi:MAG TPA: hydrolase [Flavobacteriales bacterium]|nr:hydrolase [Flavobacteriales bacterium]HIO66723.1 hydrolase [Flavobacteriales bacterium]